VTSRHRTLWVGVLLAIALAVGVVIGRGLTGPPPEGAHPGDEGDRAFAAAFPATYSDQGQRDSVVGSVTASRRNAITQAVGGASAAVVGINVVELRRYRQWSPWGDDPFFRQFFGDRTYTQRVQGLGSGFLISPDGYVLTNDHVAGNAKEITVTTTDGRTYDARLVGTDQVSDVALLKIEGGGFPHLRLGNSDDVIIGEWVIALGNPFGLFQMNDKPTVTVGVVSNTEVNLRGGQQGEERIYRGMIQTDAAINSGNSGGPLLNTLGEVIGVNSVIYTPNQGNIGLGFAIPVNRVKRIVSELKANGKVDREYWVGMQIQSVDQRIAQYFKLDRAEGVIVTEVERRGPAEQAGFRPEDIILEANGERIYDDTSLYGILYDAHAGDTIRMRVLRGGETRSLSLTLKRRST
jgi:serine protease Do